MPKTTIPVFRPSITELEIEAVNEVLRSGWLGQGPRTAEFEKAFADYCSVSHAVGVNSCTAALHLALLVAGVEAGDEVILPSFTFVSTAHAISYCGAIPVMADVNHDTLCMGARHVEPLITDKTRMVMVVHYGGQPAEMQELVELCKKHNLVLVEDCAHACGATYQGKPVGGIGDIGCFSFQAIKNLTTGDGGMLTTNNREWAERAHKLAWLGISSSTWQRVGGEKKIYSWEYAIDEVGYKYHINDIASAIGLVQLQRIEELNTGRERIADRYYIELSVLDWVELPVESSGTKRSWWNYPIRVPARHREALVEFLLDCGISVGVHYKPLHLQNCYHHLPANVPVTEAEWERLISLPIFLGLTEDEQSLVIDSLKKYESLHMH